MLFVEKNWPSSIGSTIIFFARSKFRLSVMSASRMQLFKRKQLLSESKHTPFYTEVVEQFKSSHPDTDVVLFDIYTGETSNMRFSAWPIIATLRPSFSKHIYLESFKEMCVTIGYMPDLSKCKWKGTNQRSITPEEVPDVDKEIIVRRLKNLALKSCCADFRDKTFQLPCSNSPVAFIPYHVLSDGQNVQYTLLASKQNAASVNMSPS